MPDSMDWVKANVRTCDECGRETDAGEWPDWVNGVCEECDPEIIDDYVPCHLCGEFYQKDFMIKFEDILDHSSGRVIVYRCYRCEED